METEEGRSDVINMRNSNKGVLIAFTLAPLNKEVKSKSTQVKNRHLLCCFKCSYAVSLPPHLHVGYFKDTSVPHPVQVLIKPGI